ncbi:hypothetical protein PINS_up010786 [Pythium insidiosum]|nr:hypothetical protein PINS_up010786 [Pythium insidiosum]
MPHFSDRRILRMFREALMGSSDQSFALSMAAFVSVCNDHGLVALLADDRWQDPFASAVVLKTNKAGGGGGTRRVEPQKKTEPTRTVEEIPEELPVEHVAVSPRAEEVQEEEDEGDNEDDDEDEAAWEW